MNKSVAKNISKLFALLMLVSVFTACNKKGTGCPNAFKVASTAMTSLHYIK